MLALDIGMRRTGVAFANVQMGVPLALDTIVHTSTSQLVVSVRAIVRERQIDAMVAGLPLLPDGSEGGQSAFVRSVVSALSILHIPISLLDERCTTTQGAATDPDATAAVSLLHMAIQRLNLAEHDLGHAAKDDRIE